MPVSAPRNPSSESPPASAFLSHAPLTEEQYHAGSPPTTHTDGLTGWETPPMRSPRFAGFDDETGKFVDGFESHHRPSTTSGAGTPQYDPSFDLFDSGDELEKPPSIDGSTEENAEAGGAGHAADGAPGPSDKRILRPRKRRADGGELSGDGGSSSKKPKPDGHESEEEE